MLDFLRQTGDLQNTVICYVADHGDFAGDHGLMQKNFGIYESIHRVPFLLAYPGCPAGTAVGALVESVDLYPTLARLMDVPVPAVVDGQDLRPVVEEGAPGKNAVVCEWSRPGPSTMLHAVRTPSTAWSTMAGSKKASYTTGEAIRRSWRTATPTRPTPACARS